MRILGIDPGYDRLGWAIVDKDKQNLTLVACDCIQTSKKDVHPERLTDLYQQLVEVLNQYKPEELHIEKLFFAKNVSTALDVAQARGVILLACTQKGMVVREFTPSQIKLAVTGMGNADKRSVEKMVRLQLKHVPTKLLDDVLDAIAAALTF